MNPSRNKGAGSSDRAVYMNRMIKLLIPNGSCARGFFQRKKNLWSTYSSGWGVFLPRMGPVLLYENRAKIIIEVLIDSWW